MNPADRRNGEIEVLRGIAVLFVVFHHFDSLLVWGTPWWQKINDHMGFWSGVDLFFCISGLKRASPMTLRMIAKGAAL